MKIYTKTGDKGQTSFLGGRRAPKSNLRISAFGGIDELSSFIGCAMTLPGAEPFAELLAAIQSDLFLVGAYLATEGPELNIQKDNLELINIDAIEKEIDKWNENLPALSSFILPGGTPLAAELHRVRCVCRRAERDIVTLSESAKVHNRVIVYLNRLSDLFFTLARAANHLADSPDIAWTFKGDEERKKQFSLGLKNAREHHMERVRSFEKENEKLETGEMYNVFFGDSLTEGLDVKKLFPERKVLNRGIVSDTICPKNDHRGLIRRLSSSVYNCQTGRLFILIGGNDMNDGVSLDDIDNSYLELLEEINRNVPTIEKVFLQTKPPATDAYDELNGLIPESNRRLKRIAAETGAEIIDLYPRLADTDGRLPWEFSTDGIHLSPAAYQIWSALVKPHLM